MKVLPCFSGEDGGIMTKNNEEKTTLAVSKKKLDGIRLYCIIMKIKQEEFVDNLLDKNNDFKLFEEKIKEFRKLKMGV